MVDKVELGVEEMSEDEEEQDEGLLLVFKSFYSKLIKNILQYSIDNFVLNFTMFIYNFATDLNLYHIFHPVTRLKFRFIYIPILDLLQFLPQGRSTRKSRNFPRKS